MFKEYAFKTVNSVGLPMRVYLPREEKENIRLFFVFTEAVGEA